MPTLTTKYGSIKFFSACFVFDINFLHYFIENSWQFEIFRKKFWKFYDIYQTCGFVSKFRLFFLVPYRNFVDKVRASRITRIQGGGVCARGPTQDMDPRRRAHEFRYGTQLASVADSFDRMEGWLWQWSLALQIFDENWNLETGWDLTLLELLRSKLLEAGNCVPWPFVVVETSPSLGIRCSSLSVRLSICGACAYCWLLWPIRHFVFFGTRSEAGEFLSTTGPGEHSIAPSFILLL